MAETRVLKQLTDGDKTTSDGKLFHTVLRTLAAILELNSTTRTRTRHGPDRTRTDPHGLFFAAKLRWVRAGPVGSV